MVNRNIVDKTIFARLIVLHLVRLHVSQAVRLCPGDQVVTIEDPAVSITCQPTGAVSKWLRITHTTRENTIFNGDDLYPNGIDLTRTTASKDNISGALTLNIRDVKPADALKFRCRDTMTGDEAEANLIVLESQPILVRRLVSSSTVEMSCSLKFHGKPAEVSVTWLDRHGHQMAEFNNGQRVQYGIQSKVNIPLKNTALWPATCQVSFSLRKQCGETENIEAKTFQSTGDFIFEDDDYITMTYTVWGVFDIQYPGHFLTAVISAVILVLVVIVGAQCFAARRRRRRSLLGDTETATENLASSDENDSPLMKKAFTEKAPYEELQGQPPDHHYAYIVQ